MDEIPVLKRVNDDLILTKKPVILTDPDTQNYMANMMQQQIIQNVVKPTVPEFEIKNPHEKTEQLLEQANDKYDKQIELLEQSNAELQAKLDKSNFELKQLNDKNSSQNLYIKELQADLREESLMREVAENKLSAKDWKVALISGVIGLITGLFCTWVGTII